MHVVKILNGPLIPSLDLVLPLDAASGTSLLCLLLLYPAISVNYFSMMEKFSAIFEDLNWLTNMLQKSRVPSQPIRRSPCEMLICCYCVITKQLHLSLQQSCIHNSRKCMDHHDIILSVFGRFLNNQKDGLTTWTFHNLKTVTTVCAGMA